jgi:hypothetical protein
LIRITFGGDLAVVTNAELPIIPIIPDNLELRMDGGYELRMDGGYELRE